MRLPELKSSFTVLQSHAWRQQPAAPGERWFAPDWTMLPLAARQCRVRNPINGAVAELTADRYAVLRACEGCRTLGEHASLVRQKLNVRGEDLATVGQWLDEFAAGGLLTPLSEVVQRLAPVIDSPPAPFGGIFVRTCDRPALLQRVLASAASLAERRSSPHRHVVLDDSRDAHNRSANRAIAGMYPQLVCAYVDLSAPTPLERELRRRVPDAHAAIEWLIGGVTSDETTYGRPVNYALLLSAGARLLLLDDDAVLEPRQSPAPSSQFAVSSANDELFCYADASALHAACPPLDLDPIAAHLEVLGHSVHSIWNRWSQASTELPLLDLQPEDAPRFTPGARALFSQNHVVGDPGSSLFPYHLLSLPAASQARLVSDPASARSAFAQRINWRGQAHPRLAVRRPLTLTTLAGIDNSVLVPPTARAQRNEDLLLGEVAQHVHPGGWFVDLAWALPHFRDMPKSWLDAASPFGQEPIHFLMDYLAHRGPTMSSELPEHRLQAIGAFLRDLSTAREERLIDLLSEQAADTATRTLFSIAAQLDAPDVPSTWKNELRPWLASPALSTDPVVLRSRIAPVETVRALAADYGGALEVWPALWDAARELRSSEVPTA